MSPPSVPHVVAAPSRSDSLIARLGQRAQRVLRETLLDGETVLALVNGREKQSLVLTEKRLIIVDGRLLFRASDTVQVTDLASISAGVAAFSIRVRSGAEYGFDFWPTGTNRAAAKDLVRRARELQNA